MNALYGIPLLVVLVLALVWVRGIAARDRRRRRTERVARIAREVTTTTGPLPTARSEMRSGQAPTTVMERLQTGQRTVRRRSLAKKRDRRR